MKPLKKLMIAAAALPLLTSCMSDGNSFAGIFGVSANGGKFVYANTAYAFVSFGSYGSWHIEQSSGADWCRVEQMKGAGNAYYSIPAWFGLNTTDAPREAVFTVRDDENGDDAYGRFAFGQRATRIDGSLGSAALVTEVSGDDGSRITVEYDTLCRAVDIVMTKNGTQLSHLDVAYGADDSTYFMTVNQLRADCDFAYQPYRLVSETDTVGYYEQSYVIDESWDAFNVEEHKTGGEVVAQSLLFTKGSMRTGSPDDEQSADSLGYYHRQADGTVSVERLKLVYSQNSNRRQSVDVNQLLLGVERCSPYQLISLFRNARNSFVISEASAADGKYTVETTLNADKSVATMAVTDKQGRKITYTFTYSSMPR